MLNIYYGTMPGAIYNTAMYFKNVYQESWLDDEFARKAIKSIDNSVVLGDRLIESKALGKIAPTDLSGGVKTLLLIKNVPEKVFNASTCGDNCAWWILRLARERDVTINLHHIMDFGKGKFTINVLNCGTIVHSMAELAPIAGTLLKESQMARESGAR